MPQVEPRRRALFGLSLLFVLVLASRRFSGYCSLIFSKNQDFKSFGEEVDDQPLRGCAIYYFYYKYHKSRCFMASVLPVAWPEAVSVTSQRSLARKKTLAESPQCCTPSLEPSPHTQIHPALKHVRKYYYFS